jgi:hypothetical protein
MKSSANRSLYHLKPRLRVSAENLIWRCEYCAFEPADDCSVDAIRPERRSGRLRVQLYDLIQLLPSHKRYVMLTPQCL